MLNEAKEVPRVGNIWIPYSVRSLHHFTRFFIPEIEVLSQSGDRILRVEYQVCHHNSVLEALAKC
jgi:hypothetical protein